MRQLRRTDRPPSRASDPVDARRQPDDPVAIELAALRHRIDQLEASPTRMPCYVGAATVLAPTHFDAWIYLDTVDRSVCPRVLTTGTWERGTTRFFQTYVPDGGHYVEVGANYGYYTLQAACLVGSRGRVTAFEPGPRMFTLLDRTIDINGMAERCDLRPVAVCDVEGTAAFFLKGDWHGGAGLDRPVGELPYVLEEIEVPTTTLDAVLAPGPVDFLKLDAEGAEPQVIDGAERMIETSPDLVMVIEIWNRRATVTDNGEAELLEGLARRGFRFWLIEEDGRAVERSVDQLLGAAEVARDVCCARRPPRPRPGFPGLIEA